MKQLDKKLSTTGDILNGNKETLAAESLQKGEMGRLSAPSFEKTINPQRSILEFVRKPHSESRSRSEESDIDDEEIPEDELEKMISEKEAEIKEKLRRKALGESTCPGQ